MLDRRPAAVPGRVVGLGAEELHGVLPGRGPARVGQRGRGHQHPGRLGKNRPVRRSAPIWITSSGQPPGPPTRRCGGPGRPGPGTPGLRWCSSRSRSPARHPGRPGGKGRGVEAGPSHSRRVRHPDQARRHTVRLINRGGHSWRIRTPCTYWRRRMTSRPTPSKTMRPSRRCTTRSRPPTTSTRRSSPRTTTGKVSILKKHEQPTRHGAAVGLGWAWPRGWPRRCSRLSASWGRSRSARAAAPRSGL